MSNEDNDTPAQNLTDGGIEVRSEVIEKLESNSSTVESISESSTDRERHRLLNPLRDPKLYAGLALVLGIPILYASTQVFGWSMPRIAAGVTVLGSVSAGAYRLANSALDTTDEQNRVVVQIAEEQGEIRDSLAEYERITRVLDEKEVSLDKILENQAESSQYLLLVFGHQKGPDADNDIEGSKFIRHALSEYDLINITPFTWVIPPDVVAAEGLENKGRDDLSEWAEENIYEPYPDYRGEINVMTLVDIGKTVSKSNVHENEGRGTLVQHIIQESEGFSDEDYLKALSDENINLLEVVKNGRLTFFLPLTLSQEQVELVRDHESEITRYLDDSTLDGLARDKSKEPLGRGLEEVGISWPKSRAEEIVEDAKVWKRRLDSSSISG